MSSSVAQPTIFSRIIAREIPATIVAETERIIAFLDIAPKAPVHVVVTTKDPQYQNVVELAAGNPTLLAELVAVAEQIAAERTNGQFRLVFNTGAAAGQTVFHVHAHVLGSPEASDQLGEDSLGAL
ncbi:HIT domain-containing protein [Cryobacterium levicorallinum]|uniref:HIT domain-containing protein n=1 Tax=Cryobacterium levicorallinum TaxID=995038 RepID=A0A1I2YYQ3_9MICO|nr:MULTISPECIES: HIT domain-containing protein [Cryobacterium]TFB83025.1 HIT domain-containing protein [Cryobacterium levicorallinum]GEP25507.1 histidine triad nucleotide-binding protein [Cryobacterium levicorallinum]SFH30409.1 histidine triad (HIT) family protein [Cryobacterium levicorallinum]